MHPIWKWKSIEDSIDSAYRYVDNCQISYVIMNIVYFYFVFCDQLLFLQLKNSIINVELNDLLFEKELKSVFMMHIQQFLRSFTLVFLLQLPTLSFFSFGHVDKLQLNVTLVKHVQKKSRILLKNNIEHNDKYKKIVKNAKTIKNKLLMYVFLCANVSHNFFACLYVKNSCVLIV
ncbi:hypothetical protein RFI_37179 [Reticulomyxa filosa]|uniref:Transmembrane protein n=1 Tax=Reticulomyxa filosa TaxID=46433 RepID=X6LE37_RETFI|nr:hypothetical protein RFI_37179 [Reticulomyxa filosa]|eukprot:ETO00268.1 hypothetical protein RFI_37179 [Reticulomyxa filosa]